MRMGESKTELLDFAIKLHETHGEREDEFYQIGNGEFCGKRYYNYLSNGTHIYVEAKCREPYYSLLGIATQNLTPCNENFAQTLCEKTHFVYLVYNPNELAQNQQVMQAIKSANRTRAFNNILADYQTEVFEYRRIPLKQLYNLLPF